MITRDKVTEFFCTIDEFDKNLNKELKKSLRLPSKDRSGKKPQKPQMKAQRKRDYAHSHMLSF